jgi:hypothetical protein
MDHEDLMNLVDHLTSHIEGKSSNGALTSLTSEELSRILSQGAVIDAMENPKARVQHGTL